MAASVPSVSTATGQFGSSLTIYTNRQNNSYTHTLYIFLYTGQTIVNQLISRNVGGSILWTPPLELMQHIPNAASVRASIRCWTYDGTGGLVGTAFSDNFTLEAPDSAKPVISSFTVERVDNGVPADWGLYIKGISQAKLTTVASGQYGATIMSYVIRPSGSTVPQISPMHGDVVTTGVLTQADTYALTVVVTDSRGLSATKSVTFNVIDYAPPVIQSAKFERCLMDGTPDDDGTYLRVTAKFTSSACHGHNTSSASVQCRLQGSSTWVTVGVYNTSGTAQVFNANLTDSAYEVRLSVSDALRTSAADDLLDIGTVLFEYNPNANALEFKVPVSFSGGGGGGSAPSTVNSVNGKTGDVVLSAADVGAVDTSTYAQDMAGVVKTVNGEAPDDNGNVTVSGESGTVKTINQKSPDASGNVDVTAALVGAVNISSYEQDMASVVKSVNGVEPDSNGNVNVTPGSSGVASVNGQLGAVVIAINGTATCTTAAATQVKVAMATSGGFQAVLGGILAVDFSYANTASNPVLQYQGYTAPIKGKDGAAISASAIGAGIHLFQCGPVESGYWTLLDPVGGGEDGGYYQPVVSSNGTITWTASKSGMPAVPEANIQGPQGQPGADGISPTVTVSPISGGHRVSITDSSGTQSFDVMDGIDGADGDPATLPVAEPGILGGVKPVEKTDSMTQPVGVDTSGGLWTAAPGGVQAGYCSTPAATATKQEDGFITNAAGGSLIGVYFVHSNTAANPKLSILGVTGPILGGNMTAIASSALTKGMHLFAYLAQYGGGWRSDTTPSAIAAAVEGGLSS